MASSIGRDRMHFIVKKWIDPAKNSFWSEYGIDSKSRHDLKSDIVISISMAGRTELYYAATRQVADSFLWKVSQIARQNNWPLVVDERPYDPDKDARIKKIKPT